MNFKTINIIKSPTECYYNNCFWTNCGYKGEFAKVILLAKITHQSECYKTTKYI